MVMMLRQGGEVDLQRGRPHAHGIAVLSFWKQGEKKDDDDDNFMAGSVNRQKMEKIKGDDGERDSKACCMYVRSCA